uniref:Senescence domain-containing protein n=1 Tax=Kalanchoe fedtschenkoi TaxID=63787 RepID=A0A7N0UB35_KALFE
MGCLSFFSSSSRSKNSHPKQDMLQPQQQQPEPQLPHQQIIVRIGGCRAHLMEEGEAVELANGEFKIIDIYDDNICLATIIKVGDYLQWPVTKDEPVVKVSDGQYLFSLPMADGSDPLSYGVSFRDGSVGNLLDGVLRERCCFSGVSYGRGGKNMIDWKEFAPRIQDYNNVLAKAIAGGTGQIVRGIFMCSNAYAKQVQNGGEMIQTRVADNTATSETRKRSGSGSDAAKKNSVNKSLKRVRALSKMTEKLSKRMLDGVGLVSGSVVKPLVTSQGGKWLLASVPGEVVLASLDALNKVMDAVEAAEKQTLSVTSAATTRMVSNRFGEGAGEATGDVLATVGHCAGTAWNVLKIRKAINPATSVKSGMLKNTAIMAAKK